MSSAYPGQSLIQPHLGGLDIEGYNLSPAHAAVLRDELTRLLDGKIEKTEDGYRHLVPLGEDWSVPEDFKAAVVKGEAVAPKGLSE